jgi:hypothetical protein
MRVDVRLGLFLGLCLAVAARANEPVEIATAQITGPASQPGPGMYLEYGAQFAIPLATANTSHTELGLQAGLTLTQMLNPVAGFGVDVAYHDWPTSSEFKAGVNSLVRSASYNLLELGGTTWTFTALQATGHLKFAAPFNRRFVPWLQTGAGGYWVNPRIRGLIAPDGSFVSTKPSASKLMRGAYATVGIDFGSGPGAKVGLDATYDHIWSNEDFGADFGAFALGAHVLFGR